MLGRILNLFTMLLKSMATRLVVFMFLADSSLRRVTVGTEVVRFVRRDCEFETLRVN